MPSVRLLFSLRFPRATVDAEAYWVVSGPKQFIQYYFTQLIVYLKKKIIYSKLKSREGGAPREGDDGRMLARLCNMGSRGRDSTEVDG